MYDRYDGSDQARTVAMTEFEHYCLFGEPWWLNITTAGNGWDEVRIESGGRLVARLPYFMHTSGGVRRLGMPPYTQTLGPYFSFETDKMATILAREKELVEELIARLPRHHVFNQCFHANVRNVLPWHWAGFSNSQKVSYVLGDLTNRDALWDALQSNIRSEYRKARDRFKLVIRDDLGAEALIDTCAKTYSRQGRAGLKRGLVHKIHDEAIGAGKGKAMFAIDPRGRLHAAALFVWDERTTYYLFGGGDPEHRNSGAHSFLMWEAIEHASRVSKTFDFEGSMIEPIERFFRGFGAHQQPYLHIRRTQGKLLPALYHMRAGFGALAGTRRLT